MKETTINIEGQNYVIRKLPILKFAELLKVLKGSPVIGKLMNSTDLTGNKMYEFLPELIGDSLPEVIKMLSVATDISYETIANWGLSEVVQLLTAVFKVNDFEEIKKNIEFLFQNKDLSNEIRQMPTPNIKVETGHLQNQMQNQSVMQNTLNN